MPLLLDELEAVEEQRVLLDIEFSLESALHYKVMGQKNLIWLAHHVGECFDVFLKREATEFSHAITG